jgi:hypothetical protein
MVEDPQQILSELARLGELVSGLAGLVQAALPAWFELGRSQGDQRQR